MAVPKRRKGRAKIHSRRSSNDVCASKPSSVCPQCGETKLPHHICANCGYYKDREVIVVE